MRTLHSNLPVALLLIAGIVPAASAQQQPQSPPNQQPIPAYHSPLAGAADNGTDQDVDSQNLTPDTRALAGAQNFSLGAPPSTHSYWQPHFDLSASLDSNPSETPGSTAWMTWTSVSGGIDLHRESGTSDMSLSYLGGGMLSNSGNASNGVIQALSVSDKISFRRSALSFFDQLEYLPESPSGFAGLGGVPLPGAGLGSNFTPGQSILTPRGQSLTNSFVTQFDEFLTARTSLTFVGGYSLLHASDSDLLDYGDATFQAGYNYQISRKDTIAVSYLFSGFRYSNSDQSINTHTISASYGRRVTGRLAFQVSGGPQLVFSNMPITGSPETSGAISPMQLYWSGRMALQYQLRYTQLAISYSHGVSGGSGVLPGSLADVVSASVTRQLSRATNAGLNFGYSRNTGLSSETPTPSNQTYNYWFGGINLTHSLGRMLNLNLSYTAQYQTLNSASCVGPTCDTNVLRHLITFGVGWHGRPNPIE
jgi:hypothetical protein